MNEMVDFEIVGFSVSDFPGIRAVVTAKYGKQAIDLFTSKYWRVFNEAPNPIIWVRIKREKNHDDWYGFKKNHKINPDRLWIEGERDKLWVWTKEQAPSDYFDNLESVRVDTETITKDSLRRGVQE